MRQDARAIGAVLVGVAGASAVLFGAFGAHALRNTLDPAHRELWHTAVEYHFWHALALVAATLCAPSGASRVAIGSFAVGIVFFCGSLYALALDAPRLTGVITPFGGIAFIIGWIALGFALRPPFAR